MSPGKKLLDIKIIKPVLTSMDNFGNETNEIRIEKIYEHEPYYDFFKSERKINNDDLQKAILIILSKFIQDDLEHIVLDLNVCVDMLQKGNIYSDLDNYLKEHEIMKKFIRKKGLWNELLNDDEFIEYLRKDYNGK